MTRNTLPAFLNNSQINELLDYAPGDHVEVDLGAPTYTVHDDLWHGQPPEDTQPPEDDEDAGFEPPTTIEFDDPVVLKVGRTCFERIRDENESEGKGPLHPFTTKKDYDVFRFIDNARLTRDEVEELLNVDFVRTPLQNTGVELNGLHYF